MKNFILKDENAVFYECAYSCDNEIFLNLENEKFFITDGRYEFEAREALKDTNLIITNDLFKEARKLIRKFNIGNLIFNPRDLSFFEWKNLSSNLHINFQAKDNFSQKKRIIKSSFEIEQLKKAAKFGEKGFEKIAKFIRKNPNLSEKELNLMAKNILQDNGNLGLSFEPITAINKNAAKAHALPTNEKLKENDLLLLDAGVKFERFCSDRTRTAKISGNFEFNKEQSFANSKQNEVYEIVKEAQNLAIKAIKPGYKAYEIDKIARDFIAKNGFGKYFNHSLGHGVGLDIHELPNISPRSDIELKKGMVFSVEPGIYIENEFGVRIEDVVVVTENGCEIL